MHLPGGSKLLTIGVAREHSELRLGGAQRKLVALIGHSRGEDCVLESVLALAQLDVDESGLTRLAQAIDALTLGAGDAFLRLLERVELLAGEEVSIARDDLRPLGDLLLANPNSSSLLGALEEIALELGLVLGWCADGGDTHGRPENLPKLGEPTILRGGEPCRSGRRSQRASE